MASSIDKENVKKMIIEFYRGADLPPWKGEINDNVAIVFGKMIEEANRCSAGMSLVPRPPGGKATIVWLCKTIGFATIRRLRQGTSSICIKTVIYKYGRELERASIF